MNADDHDNGRKQRTLAAPNPDFTPEMAIRAAAAELGRRGDGSAAWVWVILACHFTLAALFTEEAQQEYWAKPDALMASSFAPGIEFRANGPIAAASIARSG